MQLYCIWTYYNLSNETPAQKQRRLNQLVKGEETERCNIYKDQENVKLCSRIGIITNWNLSGGLNFLTKVLQGDETSKVKWSYSLNSCKGNKIQSNT